MSKPRPETSSDYIYTAAREAQPHLRRPYAPLNNPAPQAEAAIMWGTPLFMDDSLG